MIKKVSIMILCIGIFIFTACGLPSLDGYLVSITQFSLYSGKVKAAEKEMYAFLEDLENKTSVNVESSDVSKINKAKANEKTLVSKEVIELINISKEIYAETSGRFNPCIYPVLSLYDFGKKIVPEDSVIEALLPFTDFNDLTVDGNYVIKKHSELQIDFGAVAKGYAVDKCAEIAKKHGVTSGVVDIGRNIYLIGSNSKNGFEPFQVGITHPRPESKILFGKIDLAETSAATSGDYERFFILNGVRYCHIIDGTTGKRPDSGLISVTVFGINSTLCDAYSTALFVMGMESAVEFAADKNLNVLLIDENNQYYKSSGLDIYEIDGAYKIYEQS